MKKRSNLFAVISIFIIFIIFLIPNTSIFASSLDDQLEQIKKEKEQTQKQIEDAKKKEQDYLIQVNQVEAQLLSSLDQLNALNTNLSNVKSDRPYFLFFIINLNSRVFFVSENSSLLQIFFPIHRWGIFSRPFISLWPILMLKMARSLSRDFYKLTFKKLLL